jgi:NitT/TauT family transport system substrate-binding protein
LAVALKVLGMGRNRQKNLSQGSAFVEQRLLGQVSDASVQRRTFLQYQSAAIIGLAMSTRGNAGQKVNQGPKAAATPQLKPEKKNITIVTPNRHALVYLPLMLAEQLGYFTQMGLELEISEQQSMARAQQVVVSGAADVVCGWLENTLQQQSKGQVFQSFVLMGRAPQMALGVANRLGAVGAVNSVAQLKGRKIGVVALGTPTHTAASAVTRKAGLRLADVGFVSVGSAASATAALRSGQVDALVHMDPLMMQLQQRGDLTLLADLRDPASTLQATGLELPSSCLYTTAEQLQRLPGAMQAISDAMVLALRWLDNASLLDVMKLLPDSAMSAMGEDRQAFIGSLERSRYSFSRDGQMSAQAARSLLDAMFAAEPTLRNESIDSSRSFTNQFVMRSATRITRIA